PESMSGIENAVKAGNISDYLKEKEIRDKDHLEKTNEALIRTIENGYQEISKSSTEQISSLNGKLSDMIETIKESGKNDEIKDLLTQINRSETSLGEVLSENTAVLSERYSKEISESFDKLMQNLIPVSKMSAQGIIEIRDEIKDNLLAMLTEKDKNDRLFMKEAISRWVEAYGNEQKSLFNLVGGMDERMESIARSLADISEGRTQTRLVEFLDSFVKNFTAAESKKIQMLIDFREIISSKVLPHLHNISTIAELQKQSTETSIQLTSAVTQQNEMVAKSNQDMTALIGEASNSIKRAFAAIEKIVASQNKSVEKLNSLSDKLDSILSKQIVVFENEEKNFKLLENENKRSKAMIHNDRGVGFYHTKQLQAAVKEFKTAVDLSPELHEPYLNLGVVFSEMGENDKAKNCFTKVMEMNPDAVEAYINLGMLYVFDSKFEQAENLIKESLKFSPTYSRSYSALGEVYFRTKNYKLAEEAWKKAVELNPMDEEASSGLKQLRGDDLAE
ncbi:tetratricopeptide repeat protein, partial [candidate division WOR-3 bacterium]|nr:tetratricopeptide repeat protein [candidate division WOR-3 bacterium]